MTEIKTAQAWGKIYTTHEDGTWLSDRCSPKDLDEDSVPVIITYGLTEAEVHEAVALLEKSREVCEWNPVQIHSALTGQKTACGVITGVRVDPTRPCWCGRKVVVK